MRAVEIAQSGEIPPLPGAYALFLRLAKRQLIRVGGLGEISFPAGNYFYLGSARGPGGLRARLGRHLKGGGRPHWHIDALRQVSVAAGYGFVLGKRTRMECSWSQALALLPGVALPAPGFGSSDCRDCPAHLVYLDKIIIEDGVAVLAAVAGAGFAWWNAG